MVDLHQEFQNSRFFTKRGSTGVRRMRLQVLLQGLPPTARLTSRKPSF